MKPIVHATQCALALDAGSVFPADTLDRAGFQVGWDHAHHGLVPPAELLQAATPLAQGWMAGRAVLGTRRLPCNRTTRQWLALRLHAWHEDVGFDEEQVTARYLHQIQATQCPVTRVRLGGGQGRPDAAVVERLNLQAGYVAGNLATMSLQAVQARGAMDVMQTLRRARTGQPVAAPADGLDASAWWRLAVLQAFATPMPFAEAARLPLAVLPPDGVPVVNVVQALQVLVTMIFVRAGWSTRCRALAALLPAHALRLDFNLFVGAMAPRILEAGRDAVAVQQALEDAWLHERVLRRWQHFVLSLGEVGTGQLLDGAVAAGLSQVPPLRQGTDIRPNRCNLPGFMQHKRRARWPGVAASAAPPVVWRGAPPVQPMC